MGGPSENISTWTSCFRTRFRYLSLIGNIAEQIAKQLDTGDGDRDTLAYHLDLALTEATANAIQYGCPTDSKQSVRSVSPSMTRPYVSRCSITDRDSI